MDPVPHPFVDEEFAVELFGKSDGRGVLSVEVVDGTGHDGASAASDAGEVGGGGGGVPEQGWFCGRQEARAGVVG